MGWNGAESVDDTSTRRRILAATVEVLGHTGHTKLSLSQVALQAGVSRPTLYRWFSVESGASRRFRHAVGIKRNGSA
jgi:AraC-like DNA-binding protein